MRVQLDHKGLGEVLQSAGVAAAVRTEAEAIAEDVRGQFPGVPVVVDQYQFKARGRTSARAAFSVTFKRKDGMGWQARTGLFTQAAARRGLDTKGRAE